MKKTMNLFVYIFSIMFVLLLFSCATIANYEPGTSNPVKSDYTVLNQVSDEFSSNVFMGIFSWGDNDLKILESLKKKYNADDIINVAVAEVDTAYFGYLYIQRKFLITGTAIKYNN